MTLQFSGNGIGPVAARLPYAPQGFPIDREGGRRVPRERAWRRPDEAVFRAGIEADIVAARWIDDRNCARRAEAESPPDRHVVGVAMKTTRLRLFRASHTIFEGIMPVGTLYVTGPSSLLEAEFHTPCDFIHLYVSEEWLRRAEIAAPAGASAAWQGLDGFVTRDPLAERLARSLIEAGDAYDERYADSVGRTIVMRVLGQQRARSKIGAPKVSPLPRWRLKRVHEFVAAHIGERLALADLASAAGLSRMHFAAQFRAATGSRPHEYLLFCRIERAKELLLAEDEPIVEVALASGFQAQAHFSTVFKRLTGQTPAQWRRANSSISLAVADRRRHGGAAQWADSRQLPSPA